MELIYSPTAQEHIEFWKKSGNKQVQKRISELVNDIAAHPTTGKGKPELLHGDLAVYWNRRITDEHRIVYEIDFTEGIVYILSLKYHYKK